MKGFLCVALIPLVAAQLGRRAPHGCAADSCLRALTGVGSRRETAQPALAMADCSSFVGLLSTTLTITK
jgi:hypothetical protein